MGPLLIVILVAGLCVLWVRGNRLNRRRWLQRLDLPGTWLWDQHEESLELEGELDRGRYRIHGGGADEQGSWRLEGHDLILTPRQGRPVSLDLRLFSEGKIGVHGPGRERRVYVKKRSNVVPMRRPA